MLVTSKFKSRIMIFDSQFDDSHENYIIDLINKGDKAVALNLKKNINQVTVKGSYNQ